VADAALVLRIAEVLADFHRHVALDDLAVVQVHLHQQVRCADFAHDFMRMVLPVQKVAGNVAGIDRFDQDLHAGAGRLLASPGEVLEVGGAVRGAVRALGQQARHQVHAPAAQRLGVGQRRLSHAGAKLRLASGQAGQAAFAFVPVARRAVEQRLRKAVGLQLLRNLGLVERVELMIPVCTGGVSFPSSAVDPDRNVLCPWGVCEFSWDSILPWGFSLYH